MGAKTSRMEKQVMEILLREIIRETAMKMKKARQSQETAVLLMRKFLKENNEAFALNHAEIYNKADNLGKMLGLIQKMAMSLLTDLDEFVMMDKYNDLYVS